MSFQAMTWAVEQKLPAREKLVLLMLANRTNHDTGLCCPSHERLADECGMSKTTVKEAIRSLAERGLLRVIQRAAEGVNLPNQYVLNLHGVGRETTEGVGRQPPEGGAPAGYKPGSKTKKKKEERVREKNDSPNGDIALEVDPDLLADWQKAFPAIDVQNQIARAELWLNANPANRKSNYERFLLNWLTRAQDNAPRVGANGYPPPPRPAAPSSRRPVHESWYSNTSQGGGHVIDAVATEVRR